MIEKQLIPDQHIIDCLNTDYGIHAAALTFLPLGADMHAAVYKAKTTGGAAYFVKLKRGHQHDTSTLILSLLHEAGIRHIIPPIKSTHGQSTQAIDDFTLMVFPFVEGEDGFSRNLTDEQWITLGKTMRRVHDIKVPPALQKDIRREDFSPRWRDAVRSLYPHIAAETGGDEIARKLRAFMQSHTESIHRLVDRAEQMAVVTQAALPPFVLCHGDIHGGNVLMDGRDIIYLVDWDDPVMAPRERDLMFIGGGVANVWNKPHEEELFYQGYGTIEINKAMLAYYRHERIVEDIAILGQELLLSREGGKNRLQSYQHFIAQFEPDGVVDIAFRTDG